VPANFLLISRKEETAWSLVLSQALKPWGKLEITLEMDAIRWIAQYRCDAVVIVDATVVDDVPALISRLRDQCPQIRIVIATASPTWQRAREVLRLGAVDYIRKSLDKEEFSVAIKDILGRSLPASLD